MSEEPGVTISLARLAEVLPAARIVGRLAGIAVSSLAADSRRVLPGALFVALRGQAVDGHEHAAQAAAHGAVACVVERELPLAIPQLVVADTRAAASALANAFFGEPSHAMRVVGITGTNGKTTTTHLVAHVLDAAGERCGIVGTLGARLGDRTWPLANTTPLALELHAILAALRDAGATAVAMEVSSHALALGRVDDVRFACGALTNVTRDHLDFHGTFEAYAAAKALLFNRAPVAVLNLDDAQGAALARTRHTRALPTTTYAIDDATADVRPPLATPLAGRFNLANALCALAVARTLGVGDALARAALAHAPQIPGRMERFVAEGVVALVDYAHTPDALANVLRAARAETRGQLVVVFGCGGDRDAGKRPQMGAVARELADRTIVTSDNPRSEDPLAIARAIDPAAEIVLDRRAAIRLALAEASAGDTVVVAGKGHETYQIVGTDVREFDDRAEVRAAFAARAASR
jgi:UDP-N-acetylmuramoyl-L-alanyl-D-glutamate--2,6-diaminopimelate ligase